MDERRGNKRKRPTFSETDMQLLVDCVNAQSHIINNKKICGITPEMKRKAWVQVAEAYNDLQTGGPKSLIELKTKYTNTKYLIKKELTENANEIKMMSGGSAVLSALENVGFNAQLITGLGSRFGSNVDPLNIDDSSDATSDDGVSALKTHKDEDTKDSAICLSSIPKKKAKVSVLRDQLIEIKIEGMRLDNENKKLLAGNLKLDNRKLELEIRKLELENQKLELDIQRQQIGILATEQTSEL